MQEQYEVDRAIDREVQARLASDAAYRNAATAEEQYDREREIEVEVCRAFGLK